jgi:hypothetical protein
MPKIDIQIEDNRCDPPSRPPRDDSASAPSLATAQQCAMVSNLAFANQLSNTNLAGHAQVLQQQASDRLRLAILARAVSQVQAPDPAQARAAVTALTGNGAARTLRCAHLAGSARRDRHNQASLTLSPTSGDAMVDTTQHEGSADDPMDPSDLSRSLLAQIEARMRENFGASQRQATYCVVRSRLTGVLSVLPAATPPLEAEAWGPRPFAECIAYVNSAVVKRLAARAVAQASDHDDPPPPSV